MTPQVIVLLILAPDLSIAEYLGGIALGATAYNLAHAYVLWAAVDRPLVLCNHDYRHHDYRIYGDICLSSTETRNSDFSCRGSKVGVPNCW